MTRHPLIKTIWVLFVALFLTVQGLSQSHAAEFGTDDHSHDGITCDVTLAATEQSVLTPPVESPAPLIPRKLTSDYLPYVSGVTVSFDGRAPPPRGPPSL